MPKAKDSGANNVSDFIHPMPLARISAELRSGKLDLLTYIDQTCQRIEKIENQLEALIPEPDRHTRLRAEALSLQAKFPIPDQRPPLYGVLVGVKDIFRVDGFPTRAGSSLPPTLFVGPEASSVSLLKDLGALVLGKTVTAQFAYFDPGPTRNPYNLDHTPGGSSSGSAAAIAAGYCSLALGTQTIGSVIRPAAYCGIVGFKPSFGRIKTDGVIPVSQSLDHVGLFTPDVNGMALVASLLCQDWKSSRPNADSKPRLGIPVGPYLEQASPEGLEAFYAQVANLENAGYTVKQIDALSDIQEMTQQTIDIMAAEAAKVHEFWFATYEALYSPHLTDLLRKGQNINDETLVTIRKSQQDERATLEALMETHQIDLWISPAATGPAPAGIDSTGSPLMNLPWTFCGLPTVTLPAGMSHNALPLGFQCTGRFMSDEKLLDWGLALESDLKR